MIPVDCPTDIRSLVSKMVSFDLNQRISVKDALEDPAVKSDRKSTVLFSKPNSDFEIL